jgi:hypothetical protein
LGGCNGNGLERVIVHRARIGRGWSDRLKRVVILVCRAGTVETVVARIAGMGGPIEEEGNDQDWKPAQNNDSLQFCCGKMLVTRVCLEVLE